MALKPFHSALLFWDHSRMNVPVFMKGSTGVIFINLMYIHDKTGQPIRQSTYALEIEMPLLRLHVVLVCSTEVSHVRKERLHEARFRKGGTNYCHRNSWARICLFLLAKLLRYGHGRVFRSCALGP